MIVILAVFIGCWLFALSLWGGAILRDKIEDWWEYRKKKLCKYCDKPINTPVFNNVGDEMWRMCQACYERTYK